MHVCIHQNQRKNVYNSLKEFMHVTCPLYFFRYNGRSECEREGGETRKCVDAKKKGEKVEKLLIYHESSFSLCLSRFFSFFYK